MELCHNPMINLLPCDPPALLLPCALYTQGRNLFYFGAAKIIAHILQVHHVMPGP